MSAEGLLHAHGLGRRIGESWIWRDLSLTLSDGQRGTLVGPSGTGKSLLLRTLCGLDRPDEGGVLFQGRAVAAREMPSFRSQVLYLQQQPVLVPGRVRDNLLLPTQFRRHAGGAVSLDLATELFTKLGKPRDFLDRQASVLSGGEQQLVGLVRAMVLEPTVLLLDEPTAHLDLGTTQRVEEVVLTWADDGGRALLWTSHDPAQVERIRQGPLIALGPAQ